MAKSRKKKKSKQRKKKTKKAKLVETDRQVTSIRKFAKLCGVSHVTMSEHIRHPTWPLSKSAPWMESDAALYAEWRSSTMRMTTGKIQTDPGSLSVMMKAELAVKVERAKKMKLEREILEGQWLPREEVERQRVQRIIAIKNWLLRFPREIAGVIDYLPQTKLRRVERDCDKVIRQQLVKMAGLDEGSSDE